MAKLSYMRSSVIAKVTEGRPTDNFPLPFPLVDHIIMAAASKVRNLDLRSKKGQLRFEPSEITRFSCLAVKTETSTCLSNTSEYYSRYCIDLTFTPIQVNDDLGIVGVYIEHSMTPVRPVEPGKVSSAKYRVLPPSYSNPKYTRINDRLYFWGGDRDFTKCKILIDAAVGGLSLTGLGESISCNTELQVPILDHLVQDAETEAVRQILAMLKDGELDLIEDGVTNEMNHVD